MGGKFIKFVSAMHRCDFPFQGPTARSFIPHDDVIWKCDECKQTWKLTLDAQSWIPWPDA